MPASRRSGLVVASSSFWTTTGATRLVSKGEVWAADDPVVQADPARFKPLEVQGSGGGRVEQMTAAPGERRGAPA